MKNSIYVLLCLTLITLAGCKQHTDSVKNADLVGIWQNKTDTTSAIEFTKSGEYYVRIAGERLVTMSPLDSTPKQYIFDAASNGVNLMLFPKINGDTIKAKLVFLDTDKIKILVMNPATDLPETEFIRLEK